jgi:predicted membrane protein DUF2085
MVKILVAASIAWPLVLAAAVWNRAATGGSVWTSVLYAAASRICHQRPERSFHSAGVKWPVCGRCSGLYLAAPLGALAAVSMSRRRRRPATGRATNRRIRNANVTLVALASLPTAVTVLAEWTGLLPVSTLARALAAMPLGAAIAFVIVGVATKTPRPIEYTGAE